ncbi:MAG: hypothetical protein A2W31_00130 [Planctomycetes bacterium RBG_16_64_10]|nr:MAG: hypothetical protein A2W31_00130 [Planctomycetes bacterium RBG_16_64_10]
MHGRQPRATELNRATLVVLGVATLVASVAVAVLAKDQPFPAPAGILLWAVILGQMSVLALYVALGTGPWPVRIAILAGGLGAWVTVTRLTVNGPAGAVATDLVVHAGGVVLLAALARGAGVRWMVAARSGSPTGAAQPSRRQFSLAQLLGWTAVAALTAAMARQAVSAGARMGGPGGPLLGAGVVVGLTAAWAASAAPHWPLRWTALMVLSSALGWMVTAFRADDPGPWITCYVLQALLVAGWISAARTAGLSIGRAGGP